MKKITSICLTIFLGVNIVSAYAARGEQLAILSEDFSAFTEGTESTPAESELSTGNAMIPMEFTHGIQWKGRGIIKPEEFALYSLMMTIHMGRHKGGFKRRIPMCVWTMVTLYFDSEHVRLPKRRTRLSFICKINTVTTTIRVRNAPSPTNGKRSKSLFSTISVWGVAWSMYKSGHTTIRG